MSKSLDAVFNVVVWIIYFVMYIFSIVMDEKFDFLKVVKFPYPKNWSLLLWGHFSQRIKFYQGEGGHFLLVLSKQSF